MKKYETTFIIDSLIKNEEIEGIITKVEKFISNNGGEIEEVERWGKKRLAYEIKKRQYGYYVHVIFSAHNKLNRLLDREYLLDENIIRYLTLLVEPRSEKVSAATIAKPVVKEDVKETTPVEATAPAEITEPVEAAPEVEETAPVEAVTEQSVAVEDAGETTGDETKEDTETTSDSEK